MKWISLLSSGIFAILILCLTGSGIAAESEPSGWEGDVEIGYMKSTGNSESESLNAKLALARETTKWRHALHYETVYTHEKDQGTTAQRFLVTGRTNYNFDDRNAAYVLGLYENDRFSSYDYQMTVSTGYKRQIIETEDTEWSAEVGPGYRYSNYRDDTRESDDEIIVHAGTLFLYRFTDDITFNEDLSADSGEESTVIRSTTSFRIMLREQLSLRLSYMVRHVTEVPDEIEKTDTETFVSLGYEF